MLFKQAILEAIRRGEATRAFRIWRRPTVKRGGRLRTGVGELRIDDVREVSADDLSEADARAAGAPSRTALLAGLGDRPGRLYRIDFRLERPNRRLALAADDVLDAGALASISARLQRFDRLSRSGPWTSAVLALVDRRPGQPAGELAAEAGMHKRLFKRRVRSLREMGLTESLETGYRLSPRGRRYLDKVASRSARPAATGKPDQ